MNFCILIFICEHAQKVPRLLVLVRTWHIFQLGLPLPHDTFLKLVAFFNRFRLACVDRGPWGMEGHPKAGNTGGTPSLYLHFHVGNAHSKLDMIKISNAEIFIVYIFVQ